MGVVAFKSTFFQKQEKEDNNNIFKELNMKF